MTTIQLGRRQPSRPAQPTTFTFADLKGSLPMYSMHEALARDRMRESQQRSAEARLIRSLSAQRRWHRVARRAQAASQRHAHRVSRIPIAR